jgi:3-hydroxyisobutyrate dehydrogenase-like beta-hydroxyacid dehydrogenase
MELGFLGLGQMGSAIAERLEAADVRLHVYDPNPVAVAPFVLRGAVDEASAAAVAAAAPIVFACLPNGTASELVATQIAGSPALRIYVEMSTIGSATMARIARMLAKRGIRCGHGCSASAGTSSRSASVRVRRSS